MKTIESVAAYFKGRFAFQPVSDRGLRGYRIVDTHKHKTRIVIGNNEQQILDEIEHECCTIVNNSGNGKKR